MAGALRILIVDDHRVIRDHLDDRIREELPRVQTGKVPDLRDAFAVAAHGWDVVLLDVNLPDGNGIEALPALRALLPGAVIIVMTAFPDDVHVKAGLRLGAASVLDKSELFERLGELISAAYATQQGRDPS